MSASAAGAPYFFNLISCQTRSVLSRAAGFLKSRDIRAWAVGGLVRDAQLGRDTIDIDIAVAADPAFQIHT